MTTYLAFRLYGPLASWGDVAVGERRPSFSHPSKSAVLGLVAAALGIRREEEAKHVELDRSYGFAVRVDREGTPIRDYHTVQRPGKTNPRWNRRDEVLSGDLNTVLSSRDYLCDGMYTVILWSCDPESYPHAMEAIAEALRRPRFHLYLGRKSCPPGLPMETQLISADSLKEALEKTEFRSVPGTPEPGASRRLYWDDPCQSGFNAEQTTVRRDALRSRSRWQFAERTEHLVTIHEEQGKEG